MTAPVHTEPVPPAPENPGTPERPGPGRRRRGAVLAVVALVLLAVAPVAIRSEVVRRVGQWAWHRGPAGPSVIGLGDSVPAGAACDCEPYVSLMAAQLAPPGASPRPDNLARNRQTTLGVLAQLEEPQVREALSAADVVVVTVGANDLDQDRLADAGCDAADPQPCFATELATLRGNLDQLLHRVRTLSAVAAPVLLTGYWNVFVDGAVGRSRGADYVRASDSLTRTVNAELAAAAGHHGARFVDLYSAFKGPDGARDCTGLLAEDGDHPNAAGHQLIASTALGALSG